jgi:hypothetical protein
VTGVIFQASQAIVGSGLGVDLSGAFSAGKVFLVCLIISTVGTLFWTVMGAIIALIYNAAAALSGGLRMKFTKA